MKGKVLIVDDDPIMGAVLETRLSESGFKAHYFSTGMEALENVIEINPDIIISDIVMPVMDGYELHRRFRKNPQTASIPFVFLSARKEAGDQLEGLRMGADDYICKPFELNDLLMRMEKVMIRAAKARSFNTLADFSGNLAQMSLNDIIQIVEMNYKSGELIIQNVIRAAVGSIFFHEGMLTNAKKESLEGEDAFFDIMDIEEGFFEFYGRDVRQAEKIKDGNMSVLLKGSRLLDESKSFFKALKDTTVVPVLKSPAIPRTIADQLEPGHLDRIATLLNGKQSIEEILDSGKISKVVFGSILHNLNQAGLIDFKIRKPAPKKEPVNRIIMKEGVYRAVTDIDRRGISGVLEAKGLAAKASIDFIKGSIVNAVFGNTTGKKALYRIFAQKPLQLVFYARPVSVEPTIRDSTDRLIQEGMREVETYASLEKSTFDKRLSVHPSFDEDLTASKKGVDQDEFLPLVKKHGRIRDIIDASPMTDLRTYELLFHLVNMNMVEIKDNERIDIQLVIDSAADLPPEIIENRNITLVPIAVSFGQKTYYDGININPERFYQLLSVSDHRPEINTPRPGEFHSIFKDIGDDNDIIAIFTSSGLHDIYRNALEAKENYFFSYLEQRNRKTFRGEEFRLAVLDSGSVSLGAGLIIIEAADLIAEGRDFEQIKAHVEQLTNSLSCFIIPENMDYARKSGWISKLDEPPGGPGGKKPILGFKKGKLKVIDSLDKKETGGRQMVALIRKQLPDPDIPLKAAVMHGGAPELAESMTALIKKSFVCEDILVAPLGPSVGTCFGPGTIGVACFPVNAPAKPSDD